MLNRSMEGEILQILEKILVERCGFSVKLHAAYVEKEAGRFKEEEEAKIRMKVDAIYSRTRGRKEEAVDSTAPAQDTEQENTQSPEAKKTDNSGKAKSEPAGGVTKSFQSGGRGEFKRGEFKKGEFRKGGSFEKGALKRSDNPDVIYGRDFEEEAMKIEELIGDMGEVTIRGKVLSVDTRDIKNEKTIIIFNMSDFTDTMTIKMFVRTEQVKEILMDIKMEPVEQIASEHGVLQKRHRIIIVGWKINRSGSDIPTTYNYPTLEKEDMPYSIMKDLFCDLPERKAGEGELCGIVEYTKPLEEMEYLRKTAIRGVLNFTTQHIARPTNDNDREIYRQAVLMWKTAIRNLV